MDKTKNYRVTSRGRITIPQSAQNILGIVPGDKIFFKLDTEKKNLILNKFQGLI